MAISNAIYNTFFRRNSVYVTGIFVSAFAFGVGFDIGVHNFWDSWNRGKQWKDIRGKYLQQEEE